MAAGGAPAYPPVVFNKYTDGSLPVSFTTAEKDPNKLWRAFACSKDPLVRDAIREFRFCMYKTGVPYVCSPIVCGLDNSLFVLRMWLYSMMYAPWVVMAVGMERFLMLKNVDVVMDQYIQHAKKYNEFVPTSIYYPPSEPVEVSWIRAQLEGDFTVVSAPSLNEYADVLNTVQGWVDIYAETSEEIEKSIDTQLSTLKDMVQASTRLMEVEHEHVKEECFTVLNKGRDWFLNNFEKHHQSLLTNFISKEQIVQMGHVVEQLRGSAANNLMLPKIRAMLIVPQKIKDKLDAALRTKRMEAALLADAEEMEEDEERKPKSKRFKLCGDRISLPR
jgi:hypothetical protein